MPPVTTGGFPFVSPVAGPYIHGDHREHSASYINLIAVFAVVAVVFIITVLLSRQRLR